MDALIKAGRLRTILISVSVLLVSLHTIYFYHAVRPEIDTAKLFQQGFRFLLTVGLLVAAYQGKKWARNIFIVLFSIGIVMAIYGLVTIETSLVMKIPILVMVFVYSIAVYHFGISISYKAFFEYQNSDK